MMPPLESIDTSRIAGFSLFRELIDTCLSQPGLTTGQLLEHYRDNKLAPQLEKLAGWNDIEIDEIAEKTFKDALNHLVVSALNDRFNFLIAKERTEGLTPEERNEVSLLVRVRQ